MQSQVEKVEAFAPGITQKYPLGYEGREERESKLRSLFLTKAGRNVLEKCESLQTELNGAVAPEVVVGTVATGELQCAVPSFGNKRFTVPIAYRDAGTLYRKLDPSLVGVEMRGDVLDTDLRRSHEILASKVELPSCLATFAFPEEVRKIHETLCPSGESIRVQPYKLILYGAGDFFVPHRDSMDYNENMFGTISLGLPVAPMKDGDEEAIAAECGSVTAHNPPKERYDGYSERVGEAGQLILYVGYRESDASQASYHYEGEESRPNALTHVVDMEGVIGAAEGGGSAGVSLTMSYGAWTGDVLHEVRRVESGYRAVLTYKLFKEGHRESYIPAALRTMVEQEVSAIATAIAALPAEPPGAHFGFTLRHGYPPAGLRPECLKGVDAMVYSIVSSLYETLLFVGYEVREQEMNEMHALPSRLYDRAVFVTTEVPQEDFGDEVARDNMARKYPVVEQTVWLSLGYGTLQGGGVCFGNADCGTDWWYRQSFLLLGRKKTKQE